MNSFHECIVGIGSNIEAEKNIEAALEMIRKDFEILALSSLIRSAPIGMVDQPEFLNGAVKFIVNLDFESFKRYLKSIEDQLKRDRNGLRFGPRTIDLDIVVWDGNIVDKDYFTRDFLKRSVDEIM
jgi:2-amino-4-hydroxy-6-hydroxymethyldihydropteridine diphosphokinase